MVFIIISQFVLFSSKINLRNRIFLTSVKTTGFTLLRNSVTVLLKHSHYLRTILQEQLKSITFFMIIDSRLESFQRDSLGSADKNQNKNVYSACQRKQNACINKNIQPPFIH